ncbi:MAG TPA: pyrroline-5-carboxylate reductase [Xanthobacteraceae bacterium]
MARPTGPDRKRKLEDFSGTLVLVGAGKMGGAMLEGWTALGIDPAKIVVLEPQPSREVMKLAARGLRVNPAAPTGEASAIIIAVKPQVADEVVPTLAPWVGPSSLVISIMAGRTLQGLERALPQAAWIRAMPNLPAAIGRGITVAVADARVSGPRRELAAQLLGAVGAVEWVEDESVLDAVTAVSGSGPAYVFLLAETLAEAGAAAGLPAELAARLARATICGAGALLEGSALDAAALRRNVTSPGGTTAAALEVLMGERGLRPLLERAVIAATRRSRELAR